MYIYYPSCNFAVMHRKTAKKVKEYFAEYGREDDYHYVVYDASEKLKEAQEGDLKSGVVRMKIRFFENVEITATATSLTIKVGTKQFIFTESGLSNSSEKA